jgi:recombination protein RecR
MIQNSKLLTEAVDALATLPSIGKKSALRLVLHLLKEDKSKAHRISNAIINLVDNIKYCGKCHCISDNDICDICQSMSRDEGIVCVVENIRDMMAVEETNQFRGKYHVLGGVISPIEGIGPNQLNIESLVNRVKGGSVKELIMAISPTIEGETTIYYISKQLEDLPISISTIARGVSFGGDLEYADELTLGRSIVSRVAYSSTS